ncbi:MAG: bile acid:sodium symporter family protein [Sphaerochaeta sp.]|uniref:bile acid:sodium symporter family protein n=1 Tax=Sphaerochaeta sp. TaxID=1972642 RepID=UPI002FC8BB23
MDFIRINERCNRAMPLLTPLGVVLGLLIGSRLAAFKGTSTLIFALITFIGALGMSFAQFVEVLKRARSLLLVLFVAHIVLPVVIKMLALLVFPHDPEIVTGFILLSSIPIAVTSFIWSSIFSGNGPLSLSLILIDTLLSPILTPFTVRLLSAASVNLDTRGMIASLVWMIVLPSLLGMAFNQYKPRLAKQATVYLNPVTKLFMIAVVVINVGSLTDSLSLSLVYIPLILVNLMAMALSFALIYVFARFVLKEDFASIVSMTFAGGMRNISAALVLATTFFSANTALPVVLGILFQQTFVGFLGPLFFPRKRR